MLHLHRITTITILVFSISFVALGQMDEAEVTALFREAQSLAFQPEEAKKRLALEKYQEAAKRFHELGITEKELASNLGGAMVAEMLKQHRLARDLLQQAMPLFDMPKNQKDLPVMLSTLGQLSLLSGDRPAAIDAFTRVLPIYEQRGRIAEQAATENDLGAVYYQLGQYDTALQFFDRALKRRKQLGNNCDTAATLTNIGTVHLARGQWTTALDFLQKQALPLYNISPECELGQKDTAQTACQNNLAITLSNIGKVYYDLTDYKSARCFYDRAVRLVTQIDSKAALLNNLGTIDYALGDYPAALARFQEAKKLYAGFAETLTNIGLTQAQQDNQSAFGSLSEALRLRREVGNQNAEASTQNSLGEVYNRLGQPKEALDSLNRAIPLFRLAGDRSGEATALANAMASWRTLGNRRMAILLGKLSVNRFQELRVEARAAGGGEIERTYVRTIRQAYQTLAELLIEEGLYEQAIQVLTFYQDAQSFGGDGDIRRVSLSKREERFVSNFPVAADVTKEFSRPPTDDDKQDVPAEIAHLISAQQSLSAVPSLKGVALYTLVGETKLYVIAVSRNGIKVFSHATTPESLNQKVKDFLDVLKCADRNPYPAGSVLYETLFKSTLLTDKRLTLETFLKHEKARALLWSLDHPLRFLPMAALYDATTKQFLVEKYQTAVFTRADAEAFKREPGPWLKGIGLGTSKQFHGQSAIPGAEASLAAIFGDEATHRPGVLSGKTVVNELFRAQTLEDLDGRWPLVHVMSHFVLDPGNSRLSFLLLGNGEHYTLATMRESRDLFAGVELLSVPICDTALQDADVYGKETEALADVAQRVGARSVLASLWKVSYDVTPKLMLRFFELARAHPDWSKAELLREAQLGLLKGEISISNGANVSRGSCDEPRRHSIANRKFPFAHPYYWSAFVLYGSGR
jgi:CHAT domain-containing protein/tetratricopeptide (TPR) repeat protein